MEDYLVGQWAAFGKNTSVTFYIYIGIGTCHDQRESQFFFLMFK